MLCRLLAAIACLLLAVPAIAAPTGLPTPTPTTLGGVRSSAASAGHVATGINTNGDVTYATDGGATSCSGLSDAAASCSTNALNASNISSGTLPAGRLPNP